MVLWKGMASAVPPRSPKTCASAPEELSRLALLLSKITSMPDFTSDKFRCSRASVVVVRFFVALFIALNSSVPATAQSVQNKMESSCRKFTQEFYDWYAPLVQDISPASVSVAQRKIRERETEVLSPRLFRALRADNEAQERAKGELVGLDFDPFVGSQDPAEHYEIRKTHLHGNRCSVEIWRSSPNDTAAKSDKPDGVAQLINEASRWRFVNFQYPQLNSDLLSTLAELAKERSRFTK